ncbi:MAG: hypothetical protein ABIA92_01845 [Patescibacteria group bacterium]
MELHSSRFNSNKIPSLEEHVSMLRTLVAEVQLWDPDTNPERIEEITMEIKRLARLILAQLGLPSLNREKAEEIAQLFEHAGECIPDTVIEMLRFEKGAILRRAAFVRQNMFD